MCGFKSWNDTFQTTQQLKPVQGFAIGDRHVFGTTDVLEIRVLWTDARVIQSRRDRVGGMHLAVLVLQQVAQRSVQHAGAPAGQ
jgi:hypothetical protein